MLLSNIKVKLYIDQQILHILMVSPFGTPYHFLDTKLRPLRDDPPVDSDHGAAIIIRSFTITSELVSKDINPTTLPIKQK